MNRRPILTLLLLAVASAAMAQDSRTRTTELAPRQPGSADRTRDPVIVNPTRPPAAPVVENKSAVRPGLATFPGGEGSIEGMGGTFAASPHTGGGSYSLPIVLPPGRAGHAPRLSLSYSSQAGQGVAGLGWSLPVSVIQRDPTRRPRYAMVNGNQAYAGGDEVSVEDRFILDGQELVPVDPAEASAIDCAGYHGDCTRRPADVGDDWAEYRLRSSGGARVFRAPDYRRWVVQDVDGVRRDYGELDEGPTEVVATSPYSIVENEGRIYSWRNTRTSDRAGSVIHYHFDQYPAQQPDGSWGSENEPYLTRIHYTSPVSCASSLTEPVTAAAEARGCDAPLAEYAVRVWFTYEERPDVTASYRPGFEIRRARRLRGITITAAGDSGQRELVRRYWLTYHPGPISLLRSIQLEGRPEVVDPTHGYSVGQAVLENALPPALTGAVLPPATFEYTSAVAGGGPMGGIDWATVRTIPSAPIGSLSEADLDLFDVDRDGLPDVVRAPGGETQTYFNGFREAAARPAGSAGRFSAAVAMPAAAALELDDPYVRPMDTDGDGISEYFRVDAGGAAHSRFRPRRTLQATTVRRSELGLEWEAETTNVGASTLPDLSSLDGPRTRYLDVDADGYVDVVESNGSETFIWWNLAPYGHPGDFGSTTQGGFGAWNVHSGDPDVFSCSPISFDEPEAKTADFNGDGLIDVGEVIGNHLAVYYGRGDGTFGSDACEHDVYLTDALAGVGAAGAGAVRFADLNGDGWADAVSLSDNIAIALGGPEGFDPVQTQAVLGTGQDLDLRLADIDGDGMIDILRGESGNWSYFTPGGLHRPRLLERIDNGLGAVTTIEYGTGTAEYLRDLEAADQCDQNGCTEEVFRWEERPELACESITGCPAGLGSAAFNVMVVKAIEVRDGFGAIRLDDTGMPDEQVSRTEYDYHDGAYDANGRALLGFAVTDTHRVGDASHPDGYARTRFHQARRPAELAGDGLAANPYAPLQGQPYLSESWVLEADSTRRYGSTEHTTHALRTLLFGLDGRPVQRVDVQQTDKLMYGTEGYVPGYETLAFPGVVPEGPGAATSGAGADAPDLAWYGDALQHQVHARASSFAHVRSRIDRRDNLGAVWASTEFGRLRDEGDVAPQSYGETIHRFQDHRLHNGQGQWITVTDGERVTGEGTEAYQVVYRKTDELGRVIIEGRPASADVAFDFGELGTQPAGSLLLAATRYDAWGNPVVTCEGGEEPDLDACLHYAETTYDKFFADLVRTERVHVGETVTGGFLKSGIVFDRGLGVPWYAVDPANDWKQLFYDGLGRPTALFRRAVDCSPAPALTHSYEVGDPVHVVRTRTRQSCDAYGEERVYVDGLGRPRGRVSFDVGSDTWVRSGIALLDSAGEVRRAYQVDRLAGADPTPEMALVLPTSPSVMFERDGFGRTVRRFDELGQPAETRYGALSTETWDAEDLGGGPLSATPTIARVDGHQRAYQLVQHNRLPDGTGEEFVHLTTAYRADGSPMQVFRWRATTSGRPAPGTLQPPGATGEMSGRTMVRDTMGRTLAVFDPSVDDPSAPVERASWRYLWGASTHLMAVRDPRGCGQDFFYDPAGRMVGERVVGCPEAVAPPEPQASLPPDAFGAAMAGPVHVRTWFDQLPPWYDAAEGFAPGIADKYMHRGRIAATEDTVQRSVVLYDERGRPVREDSQLARITEGGALGPIATLDAAPPAAPELDVVFDTERTYVATQTFDAMDRVVTRELPPEPDWALLGGAGDAPEVSGHAAFDERRGLLAASYVEIDGAAQPLVRSVQYTPHGAPAETWFGSVDSELHTTLSFDAKLRLDAQTTTRAPTGGAGVEPSLEAVTVVAAWDHHYDEVDRLERVDDLRHPEEWVHAPRSVEARHDALSRVVGIDYGYATGAGSFDGVSEPADDWRDDHAVQAAVDPMRPTPAPMVSAQPAERPVSLTYAFDWLGNLTAADDDAHAFYERSIGELTHGVEVGARPSAPYLASNLDGSVPSDLGGYLSLDYGRGGNVRSMTVHGQCTHAGAGTCVDPGGSDLGARRMALESGCSCAVEQHYTYAHDAVNRIVEARRYDRGGSEDWQVRARQRYGYDHANQRRIKLSESYQGGLPMARTALYVRPGEYERRGVTWDGSGWAASSALGSESQYLVSGARIVWSAADPVTGLDPNHRITFTLRDALGSTSAVVDLQSNELVSHETRYPNGTRETLTVADTPVPGEPTGFTGKEADDELGLTYFGERYLLSHLAHWATPDPAEIHAAAGGELANHYHYVGGRILDHIDPLGLAAKAAVAPETPIHGDTPLERMINTWRFSQGLEQLTFHVVGRGTVIPEDRKSTDSTAAMQFEASQFLNDLIVEREYWIDSSIRTFMSGEEEDAYDTMVERLDRFLPMDESRQVNAQVTWWDSGRDFELGWINITMKFGVPVGAKPVGVWEGEFSDVVRADGSYDLSRATQLSIKQDGATANGSLSESERHGSGSTRGTSSSGTFSLWDEAVLVIEVHAEIGDSIEVHRAVTVGQSDVLHFTRGAEVESESD